MHLTTTNQQQNKKLPEDLPESLQADFQETIQEAIESVAIVIGDLSCANNISNIFKKYNLFPYIFTDIEEYLMNISNDTFNPYITIFDIKEISGKTNLISNHPFFKEVSKQKQKHNLFFYYDDQSKPLLPILTTTALATYLRPNQLIFHSNDNNLQQKLLTIIERFKKNTSQTSPNESNHKLLQKKITTIEAENKLHKTSLSIIDHINQEYNKLKIALYEKSDSIDSFDSIFSNIKKKISFEGKEQISQVSLGKLVFTNFLSDLFDQMKSIEKFSFIFSKENSNKKVNLLSPSLIANSNKYFTFPLHSLGLASTNGINATIQNKIITTAVQIAGEHCWFFNLTATDLLVNYVVIIKFKDDHLYNDNAEWNLLEPQLNNIYSNILSIISQHTIFPLERGAYGCNFIKPWEFLNSIENKNDKIHFEKTFVCIDFRPLLTFMNDKHYSKFFWRPFIEDFFGLLKKESSFEFDITYISINIFFIVIAKNFEHIFLDSFYKYIKAFSYNKYFEDSHILSTHQYILPEVTTFTSLARKDYLKLL
ncbi:MAG: hypothetical protein HQK49_01005 [Oligoflexia bacterium]|nr:hypothetical protein [Oligoflexia bacterium]